MSLQSLVFSRFHAIDSFRWMGHRTSVGVGFELSVSASSSFFPHPLHVARRRFVNALWRMPPQHSLPTHAPSGEEVDVELFQQQVRRLFEVLKVSQLVDMIHEMRSCPYYDSLFTNEVIFQYHDMILPMPKYGREHRSTEISETIRYMRGCGATGDVNHILQDTIGGRASGADFVATSHGVLMGYGTHRTNKACVDALTGASAETDAMASQLRALSVEAIEMDPESPPLADIMAFSGFRTLIISDTVHGHHAAELTAKRIPKIPWQVLKLDPNCHFLSHLCGAKAVFDVLCDQDFPQSMERLGEAGLNPFPVEWSEPRKLGVSMRSVCLILRFARGSMSGGGYANNTSHVAQEFNYNSQNIANKARLFQGGRRRHGDMGAPLEAQLRSGELPEPVYQRPPRYAPPMHQRGSIVPK